MSLALSSPGKLTCREAVNFLRWAREYHLHPWIIQVFRDWKWNSTRLPQDTPECTKLAQLILETRMDVVKRVFLPLRILYPEDSLSLPFPLVDEEVRKWLPETLKIVQESWTIQHTWEYLPECMQTTSCSQQKSPLLAGTLELVFPGAGMWYAGARYTAIANLITTLGYGGMPLELALHQLYTPAWILAGVVGWLRLAQVSGAVVQTHRKCYHERLRICTNGFAPLFDSRMELEDFHRELQMYWDFSRESCQRLRIFRTAMQDTLLHGEIFRMWKADIGEDVPQTFEHLQKVLQRLQDLHIPPFFLRDPWQAFRNLHPLRFICLQGDSLLCEKYLEMELQMALRTHALAEARYFLALTEYWLGPPQSWKNELLYTAVAISLLLQHWEEGFRYCVPLTEDSLFCRSLFYRGKKAQRPRWKDSTRAHWIALLTPGGGHVYAGYPHEGVWNGILQLSAVALTGYLVYHRLYYTAFMGGGSLLFLFRVGSVRRTQVLVRRRNLRLTREILARLKKYVQVSSSP